MAIIDRWEELEKANKIPQSRKEWIKIALEQEEALERKELQIINLSTALDSLNDWASIIRIAKHNGVSENIFNWRLLKKESDNMGFIIKKAPSPYYRESTHF